MVGIVKRAGGDPHHFVPIARVALHPWIRAVEHLAFYRDLFDAVDPDVARGRDNTLVRELSVRLDELTQLKQNKGPGGASRKSKSSS